MASDRGVRSFYNWRRLIITLFLKLFEGNVVRKCIILQNLQSGRGTEWNTKRLNMRRRKHTCIKDSLTVKDCGIEEFI